MRDDCAVRCVTTQAARSSVVSTATGPNPGQESSSCPRLSRFISAFHNLSAGDLADEHGQLSAQIADLETRKRAQEVGGDLSIAPELPVSGFEESASRYDELLYHWAESSRKPPPRSSRARSSGHHHRSRRALPVCRRVANRLGGARSWLYSAGHRRRA